MLLYPDLTDIPPVAALTAQSRPVWAKVIYTLWQADQRYDKHVVNVMIITIV